MGKNYKFKISHIIPNAWFNKLKDMSTTLKIKTNTKPKGQTSPSQPPPTNTTTQISPQSSHRRSDRRINFDYPQRSLHSSRRRSRRIRHYPMGPTAEIQQADDNTNNEPNYPVPGYGSSGGEKKNFVVGGSHYSAPRVANVHPSPPGSRKSTRREKNISTHGSSSAVRVANAEPGPSGSRKYSRRTRHGPQPTIRVASGGPGPRSSRNPVVTRVNISGYESSSSTQGLRIRPYSPRIGGVVGERKVSVERRARRAVDLVRQYETLIKKVIADYDSTDNETLQELLALFIVANDTEHRELIELVFNKIWLDLATRGPWWK